VSNPLAIAAVTATFSQILGRVIEEPTLSGATVSMGPPDAVSRASKDRQLNLFLYGISPNAAWRNMDLPFRGSNGDGVNQPVLTVDLHYLVTAYGQGDDEVDSEHLLARAMSLVHDNSILTPDQIRAAQVALPAVAQSDLANQTDLVRISPQALSLEEVSKLWGMFQTTNFRTSVAYEAAPVLIERSRPAKIATPVRIATLTVLPIRRPVIDTVTPQVAEPGQQVSISGRHLLADHVEARFGAFVRSPDQGSDTRVAVTLPAALPAGVNTVQIVQRVDLGSPPAPHRGFESNIIPFVLRPQLTTPSPSTVAQGSVLTLAFEPTVGPNQRLSALIGDQEILANRPSPPAPASSADFPIPSETPTGDHLLRVRVDGAESPLQVAEDPASPTFGQYVGPIVTVTP
jgi:hypothetical protein